jgi:ATP synthase protein I
MDNFAAVRKGSITLIMLVLSIMFLVAALLPGYRPLSCGFLVGGAASLYNTIHLARKIERLGEAAVERKGRKVSLGYVTRASVALLAGVISVRFGFSLAATAAGLLLAQSAAYLQGVISLRKRRPGD